MEGGKINPNWIRPNLFEEKGEVERTVKEFLGMEPTEENIKIIMDAIESAPVVDFSDQEWELLENTDSFSNVRPGHLEDAEKIVEEYNLKLTPENKRDFKNILNGFQNGGKMKVPTILRDMTGKLHLVSGNTRLMISRALNIRPKVVVGKLK